TLRDDSITIGRDDTVLLQAKLTRGLGPLDGGTVYFSIFEGEGTLDQEIVDVGHDGLATVFYTPPPGGPGTAKVVASYFEKGTFYQSKFTIQDTGKSGDRPLPDGGLNRVPTSETEQDAKNTIIGTLNDAAARNELPDEDILKGHLRAWFVGSVEPGLAQTPAPGGAQNDDGDLLKGLHEFLDWQSNVGLLGLDPGV